MSAFCSCTRCLAIFRLCWDLYVSKITETHRLIPSHTPTTMKLTKNTAVTGLGTARAPSPPPPTASAGRMTSGKFSVVMSTVIATDASNALSKFPRVSASATSYRPWYSCTPSADHATTTVPTRDTVGANLGMVFNALDTNWRSGRTCATSNSGRRHRVGRDREPRRRATLRDARRRQTHRRVDPYRHGDGGEDESPVFRAPTLPAQANDVGDDGGGEDRRRRHLSGEEPTPECEGRDADVHRAATVRLEEDEREDGEEDESDGGGVERGSLRAQRRQRRLPGSLGER